MVRKLFFFLILFSLIGVLAAADTTADRAPARAAGAELPALEQEDPPMSVVPPEATFDFLPDQQPASCTCTSCGNTGQRWGLGSSCQAAHDNLVTQLWDAADDICPGVICNVTVNITTSCWYNSSKDQWQEDGNGDVVCKICTGQSCFIW